MHQVLVDNGRAIVPLSAAQTALAVAHAGGNPLRFVEACSRCVSLKRSALPERLHAARDAGEVHSVVAVSAPLSPISASSRSSRAPSSLSSAASRTLL